MTLRHLPLPRWLAPALLALAGTAPLTATHAADVGVSIAFSEPGLYGRVDIGRYPSPVLMARHPVVIGRAVPHAEPVYLWVPPGHRRDWRRHCSRYGACGAPVYFVEDGWYRQNVIVERDRHDEDRHPGKGHGKDKGKGKGTGTGTGHD